MLRRKDIAEAVIDRVDYPNKGHFTIPETGETGQVKNTVPGQKVLFRVFKKHNGHAYGRLISVTERSPLETRAPFCDISDECGGCMYQRLPYDYQLQMKTDQMQKLLAPVLDEDSVFDGIRRSPREMGYRNKTDFSFGDEVKGGPMTLGMHRLGTRYTVLNADTCALAHPDLPKIAACVREYCAETGLPFFNKVDHVGYFRFLLLRRSETTGEILVCLATSTQYTHDFSDLAERLRALPLEGKIVGIWHADDDRFADALLPDELHCLYGTDSFTETILGFTFRVSLFSFFQTNTKGAEVLYETVRSYVNESGMFEGEGKEPCTDVADEKTGGADGEDVTGTDDTSESAGGAKHTGRKPVLYDLYSGTGTIGQMMSPAASHVYGIEIVPEAVEAAKKNAALNGLTNCTFIAGDVPEILPTLPEKPDYLVLDPPREGIHPKALAEIIGYNVPNMVYVSCKATSFVRDMEELKRHGYQIRRWSLVDMFPQTVHVETVVLLQKQNS
ncbi:MAG: class I SAM-dependent RNA methyltransferase [Eubacteriales bacterium]|nr:class I SAM-dependent RNA methyltransferase [Eubacteriales bacterium]